MSASIVVCTRNRAASLQATLDTIGRIDVPGEIPAELIVVDNASTDGTREVVAQCRVAHLPVRYVREGHVGVARARNTGIAAAHGDIILFLDDDVRPPADWLPRMTGPILSGAADALAGGVRIPEHLQRPWMEAVHRVWLASTEYIDGAAPQEMVSANMAFARHVLARVPGFDPELGPGAIGQGEDALFSWQLLRAGFRIAPALDVAVEHHFDPSRLLRSSFRATAERRGRTMAYHQHHWEHLRVPAVRRRWIVKTCRLAGHRLVHRHEVTAVEGMPSWELYAIEKLSFLRQWRIECRRVRNYERYGLVKRHDAHGLPSIT